MTKKDLDFKLEYSEKEEITPYAGLGIYGELYNKAGISDDIGKIFPKPGSGAGFEANTYINSIAMMFIGGGKYLEDIEKIKVDKGLRKICKLKRVAGPDGVGEWLKRAGDKKIEYMEEVNEKFSEKALKMRKGKEFTLDIDATGIEAEKSSALYTYKGYKGYMPILGFLAELAWCIGYEFREGNVAPAAKNYEFTKKIIEFVEKTGKKIKRFRSDSAAYQAKLMNKLNKVVIKYTITVSKDEAVKAGIANIKETEWKKLKDKEGEETVREYAEFIHTMNESDHAFRIIVQRWINPQRDLFEGEEYCYHGIATNYLEEEKTAQEIIRWHNGRSNSENYNKEVKAGFNLEYMPCDDFNANAVWFATGILAYNLFIASKLFLFPKSWINKKIGTVRWQFIQMPGKVMRRPRYLILRVCSTLRETYDIYQEARRRCLELEFQLL